MDKQDCTLGWVACELNRLTSPRAYSERRDVRVSVRRSVHVGWQTYIRCNCSELRWQPLIRGNGKMDERALGKACWRTRRNRVVVAFTFGGEAHSRSLGRNTAPIELLGLAIVVFCRAVVLCGNEGNRACVLIHISGGKCVHIRSDKYTDHRLSVNLRDHPAADGFADDDEWCVLVR